MKKNKKLSTFYFLFSIFSRRGFTIIELLIVIGILVFLISSVVFLINPGQQFAKSRNNERKAHLNVIITAIGQNIFGNRGVFDCVSGEIPTSTTRMATSAGNYDIGPCLVPAYIHALPTDPSTSGVRWVSEFDYDTGYYVFRDNITGRVTVSAPAAELGENISVTR